MNRSKQRIVLIVLLSFALVYGISTSYTNYYPSSLFPIYLAASVLTLLFSIREKIFQGSIDVKQGACITLLVALFFCGWKLVVQDWRFGFFLYASICFLVSGLAIFRSGATGSKVLFMVAFLVCAINIVPVLFYFSEKTLITQELISPLFISNKHEITEYLAGRTSYKHVLVILVFLAATIFIFRLNKKTPAVKISLSLWMLFIISFFTTVFSGPVGAVASEYASYMSQTKKFSQFIKERSQRLQENKFTVVPDSNAANKLVIVIGESLNRNYMELYGYGKPTTPNLSALLKDSGLASGYRLFTFDNVISPEVTTVPALKKVLTNMSSGKSVPFEESLSIVDYFNKAGYITHWISNQEQLGTFSTPISVISASANKIWFTASDDKNLEAGGSLFRKKYDEALLPYFEQLIAMDTARKEVYILHLMGNHQDYANRYPEKFNIFRDEGDKAASNSSLSYLNSVIYNDWVVSQIMAISKKHGIDAVIYFSDHGEDIASGHNPENFKPGLVEIPFLIYISEKYLGEDANLKNRLTANKNTPAINDNFFNFIQDFSGIKSSLYDSTASFISPYYISRKRMVNNRSNEYDK